MRFDRWNTAFCDMDVQILSLSYRTHRVTAGTQEPRSNELRSRSVEVISGEDRFRIDADAIRSASWLKRIAGIVGRADAQAPRPGRITFRVRNHGWTEESPLSFMHERVGGWSYVIATDGQYVEMLEDDYQQLPIGLVGRHGRCRYDPASKNRLVAACLEPSHR